MAEFFIEIGSEEIPSSYIEPALNYMKEEISSFFSRNRIEAETPKIMGTPRRLVVSVKGVTTMQKDSVDEFLGPGVSVAYDEKGQPTKAAIGFARGKGLDVANLTRKQTPKGEVVCALIENKGRSTSSLLNEYLPQLIHEIPFQKKMRWANNSLPFARPLHWVAALFDGKALEFEFDGIANNIVSRGHRFLKPEQFQINGIESYLKECEKHFLMIDPATRKASILEQVQDLAKQAGGYIKEDGDLLNLVNFLVEYPVAIKGNFDPGFLELPKELLVISMKYHQKYFPVWDKKGNLLPCFITVSNMLAEKSDEIKKGNERVLRARLEDARFFYDEDRKKKFEDFVEPLKGVVFQKKLGTIYEKVCRITDLAGILASLICPQKEQEVRRAAYLSKADLVSQMVFEFPELQGIMGGYYALHAGENAEVAKAIAEHYRPTFAGDDLPTCDLGSIIAVADKLDTIVGCIGVGLIPSGSEDPYGLRRHALGILQIILNQGWQFSFQALIQDSLNLIIDKAKLEQHKIKKHIEDLFSQRYKTLLNGEGFDYDAIDCVLSTGMDSVVDVRAKVEAFTKLKKQPHFEPLAIAFKRVASILEKKVDGEIDPGLLNEPAEKQLYEAFLKVRSPVLAHIKKKEFSKALEKMGEIKPSVDNFFDNVMVMVDDASLCANRMCLLRDISSLFSDLADFSKIVVKKA